MMPITLADIVIGGVATISITILILAGSFLLNKAERW